ncbi:MAG TPA: serine/threonine-protein kinase [Polyangiales bacterium]|nr:serine/threonine-protein kinase [Polyangiales bacterium]
MKPAASEAPDGVMIGGRYALQERLGRGGMASVYRAADLATGQTVALKQLTIGAGSSERALLESLFEREFHTLAELQHPRVIAVYDYGVDGARGPFYTMELLDGGDLRDRAPLPWTDACSLLFDVCSSLALLHSRRLIHRDVTPRNVRCTRDGRAKLIDFGALAAMGAAPHLIGTPAFVPPEAVHHQTLDGRADLYSLGATLYHALTGNSPYRAANFRELREAWQSKVAPPSAYAAQIPTELDDLVLSLIHLDPALRPQSAFEVMERLAACAGLTGHESDQVSRAYLTTPTLVGREQLRSELRRTLSKPVASQSIGLMLSGAPGVGRSRVLDACLLDAKSLGFTVLRATAQGAREPFAVAHALLQHLIEVLPSNGCERVSPELFVRDAPARLELRSLHELAPARESLKHAMCRVLSAVTRTQPLLLAVDDVHRIDPESGAVLATVMDSGLPGRLFVIMTVDGSAAASEAHAVLARRCTSSSLDSLSSQQTHALLGSLFGDVANLKMLSDEVFSVARGNPRQCLDLAQHLVDKGMIRYRAGTWTLPTRLVAGDLPVSVEAAMHGRIAELSAPARFLAEAHALAYFEVFAHADYRALLSDTEPAKIDRAISELETIGALIRDGQKYTLANRLWAAAFKAGLEPVAEQKRHEVLARLYAERSPFALQYHLFSGGMHEAGVDLLLRLAAEWDRKFDHAAAQAQNVGKMSWCAGVATETAERLGRSPRQINQLRRWYAAAMATTDSRLYAAASAAWLEQLKHDSGFELWERDSQASSAAERLTRALQAAHQRYLDTPEAERVYSVTEALRLLVEYVVLSIAVGARTSDTKLVASLPQLLEPFVALSPAIDVIFRNATATYRSHCECRYADAYAIWLDVLGKLDAMTDELQHLEPIRGAVTFAVGMIESQLGLASASSRAERLDRDPYQKITALQLRKIVRLEQGDWDGADQLRRQAEVMALQVRTAPLFKTLLSVEASAYGKARDLRGLAQVVDQLRLLASEYPGWIPHLREAEARFHLARGDYAAARDGFERTLELTAVDADGLSSSLQTWIAAQAGLAETLLAMGCMEEAHTRAHAALAICEKRGIDSHTADLIRAVSLIEAKLGKASAAVRLDALIAQQLAVGCSGLRLGLSYEARAQIAIWSADQDGFEKYSQLTAHEYRHGLGCPLGARYERLINEAKRRGFMGGAPLADFEPAIETALTMQDDAASKMARIMAGTRNAAEHNLRALRALCVAFRARGGYLFERTPTGLQLASSLDDLAAPAVRTLCERALRFFETESERVGYADDIASSALEQAATQSSTVQVGGCSYELLLLSCVEGAVRNLAGVVALSVSASGIPYDSAQLQLIPAVTAQLLAAARVQASAATEQQ